MKETWGIIATFSLGAAFFGFWYFNTRNDVELARLLQKEGIQTEAIVEKVKHFRKTRYKKKKYKEVIQIAFKAAQDTVHTAAGITWTEAMQYHAGEAVNIYYLPSNPSDVMLASKVQNPDSLWLNSLYPQYFLWGLFFWGLLILAWAYRHKISKAKPIS